MQIKNLKISKFDITIEDKEFKNYFDTYLKNKIPLL